MISPIPQLQSRDEFHYHHERKGDMETSLATGETREQKLDRALLAVQRLLRSAAEYIACARHELDAGAPACAQRSLNEGGKQAADALSVLNLLPGLTGEERGNAPLSHS